MASVTQRISQVKQPRSGYIKPSDFECTVFKDNSVLNENESIHSSLVGLSVDYLTRFMMGATKQEAFSISLLGVKVCDDLNHSDCAITVAKNFLANIKGLDDLSIINACKLTTFDVWYRNTSTAQLARTYKDIYVDTSTIENIRILVNRTCTFFNSIGGIVQDGFTFEPYGYTDTVNSGDGDFLTSNTLWDLKVLKSKITSKHTLQLLMYWIMGKHSGQAIFDNITKIGVFNPRLNTSYVLNMDNVSESTITFVEKEVIGYN